MKAEAEKVLRRDSEKHDGASYLSPRRSNRGRENLPYKASIVERDRAKSAT